MTMKDEKRNAPKLTEKQTQNEKTKATVAQKHANSYELPGAPYIPETTKAGFSFFPVNGARIVNGLDAKDVEKIDAETLAPFLQMTKADFEKNNVAFTVVTDKAGNTIFRPTLTRLESALTVAILAEFVEQSRSFYDIVKQISDAKKTNEAIDAENEKIQKANEAAAKWNACHDRAEQRELLPLKERVEVPARAYVGQDADFIADEVKNYMLSKYNVNPFLTFADARTLERYEAVTEDDVKHNGVKNIVAFQRLLNTGKKEILMPIFDDEEKPAFEIVRGVETFHCARKNGERVDVIKWKQDKFIFLNLSKFWRKYFKTELTSGDYKRAVTTILNLGTKRVPCFDESGQFTNTQFYSTYFDAFRFGRDFYALLRLETPNLFAGTETADDYLKLTENFENILSEASDVELRLWLAAVDIRTANRRFKKDVAIKSATCQQMFEEFATPSDVEARKFARFWPKFRTAALRLTEDKTFLFFNVNGEPMTPETEAKPTDKVEFGVNMKMLQRHAPVLKQ